MATLLLGNHWQAGASLQPLGRFLGLHPALQAPRSAAAAAGMQCTPCSHRGRETSVQRLPQVEEGMTGPAAG